MQFIQRSASHQALHSSNVALHNNTVAALKQKLDLRPKKDLKSRSAAELLNEDSCAAVAASPKSSRALLAPPESARLRPVASLPSLGCGECWTRQQEVERLRRDVAALKLSLRLALDAIGSPPSPSSLSPSPPGSTEMTLSQYDGRGRCACCCDAAVGSPCSGDSECGCCCRRRHVSSGSGARIAKWPRPMDCSGEICDRYGQLYSKTRRKALAALGAFASFSDAPMLREKLLLSIIVLAHRKCRPKVRRIRERVNGVLNLSDSSDGGCGGAAASELSVALSAYLVDAMDSLDVAAVTKEVSDQVHSTLFDYPCLATCDDLVKYTEECVRFAWALCVLKPDCDLVLDAGRMRPQPKLYQQRHEQWQQQQQQRPRALSTDSPTDVKQEASASSDVSAAPLCWPAIVDSQTGACIHEGYAC